MIRSSLYDKLLSSMTSLTRRHLSASSIWSGSLSFATPEADFCDASRRVISSKTPFNKQQAETHAWKGQSRWMSPHQGLWATTAHDMSVGDFSSLWSATGEALPVSHPQSSLKDLPRTLRQAMMEEHRALVVTTADAPHRIVHVNRAWEDLCGYKKHEVLHRSLNIIQGPLSNTSEAMSMVNKLETSLEPQEAYLVNYRKNGEAFYNHVTAGPLFGDNDREIDFMVGILEEVSRDEVPLRAALAQRA